MAEWSFGLMKVFMLAAVFISLLTTIVIFLLNGYIIAEALVESKTIARVLEWLRYG